MNKEAFLNTLREKLSSFPQSDTLERIAFYEEMIDDRIEEGMTEEEAVAAAGSAEAIAAQMMDEIPLPRLVLQKMKPKRGLRGWEIALLILGSPVWAPLAIAAVLVMLSVYVVIWTAVLCVYAANLSLAAGALFSIPSAVQYFFLGNPAGAFFALGAGIALAGLSILMYFASRAVTMGVWRLTKRFLLWTKSLFLGKEDSYENESGSRKN